MPDKGKPFFSFDENTENKEFYVLISKSGKDEGIFDDIELFDIEASNEIGLAPSESMEEVFEEDFEGVYDEDLTNPIRHYIREMGGMSLLTREGEREIAMRIEESQEEIKRIIFSFPGTVKELLNTLNTLKSSKVTVKDVTLEVDEEEDAETELEFQRERVIGLLERLRHVSNQLDKADTLQQENYRQEVEGIIREINPGRKMIEKIVERMRRYVDRIEKLEKEIEKYNKPGHAGKDASLTHRRLEKIHQKAGVGADDLKAYLGSIKEAERRCIIAKNELVKANLRLVVSIAKR